MKATYILVCCLAAALVLTAYPVQAWGPSLPDDADASWNPPSEEGLALMPAGAEAKSSSAYSVQVIGIKPVIEQAYLIDESGRRIDQVGGSLFYLVVSTNSPGYFYTAEYFPRGSGRSPQWLIYRNYLTHGGMWTLGPFHCEITEPTGWHAWKLWLYNAGFWALGVTGFNCLPYYQEPPLSYPPPGRNMGAGEWGPLQVTIVAVLTGVLGITTGILLANRRRQYSG